MLRPAIAVAAVLAASCTAERTVEERGGYVIAVDLSAEGVPSRVAVKRPGEEPLHLAIADTHRLVLFEIGAGELIGPDGRPLPAETIAGLRAVAATASVAAGGCGRCLAYGAHPPQTIYPGDRCRLPRFASTKVIVAGDVVDDPEAVQRARDEVRLSWPGACACTPTREPPPPPLTFRFVSSAPDAWPAGILAQAQDGELASFDIEHAVLVSPSGARTRFDKVDRRAVCSGTSTTARSLPFTGPIFSAAALQPGRYLVASLAAQGGVASNFRGASFERFDAREGTRHLDQVPVERVLFPTAILPVDADTVILAGSEPKAQEFAFSPSLHACGIGESTIECTRLLPFEAMPKNTRVTGVASLPDRSALVVADGGGVALYERFPGSAEMPGETTVVPGAGGVTRGEIPLVPRGTIKWKAFAEPALRFDPLPGLEAADTGSFIVTAGALGTRAFACAQRTNGARGALVLTATLSADDLRWERSLKDRLRVSYCTPRTDPWSCGSFAQGSAPDRMRLSFNDGSWVELDAATGLALDPSPCPGCTCVRPNPQVTLPGLSASTLRTFELTRGWTAAVDVGGTIYLRRDGETAFNRAYGPPVSRVDPPAAVLAIDDRTFWALSVDGRRSVVTVRSPEDVVVRDDAVTGLGAGQLISGAARDPDTGLIVAVGYQDGANGKVPLVWRLAGEPPRLEPLALPAATTADPVHLLNVAAVGGERFAIIGEAGRVLWVEGGVVLEVPSSDLDDPATPEVELAPLADGAGCLYRRLLETSPESLERYRAIDGGQGVAWATGCNGIISRITRGEVVRFFEDETIGRVASVGTPARLPDLLAVRVLCPDEIAFGASGLTPTQLDRGRAWRLTPLRHAEELCASADLTEHPSRPGTDRVTCKLAESEATGGTSEVIASGSPMKLFGERGRLGAVFSSPVIPRGTITRYETTPRFRSPVGLIEAAQSRAGHVLAAGDGGKLVLGYQCPR